MLSSISLGDEMCQAFAGLLGRHIRLTSRIQPCLGLFLKFLFAFFCYFLCLLLASLLSFLYLSFFFFLFASCFIYNSGFIWILEHVRDDRSLLLWILVCVCVHASVHAGVYAHVSVRIQNVSSPCIMSLHGWTTVRWYVLITRELKASVLRRWQELRTKMVVLSSLATN